MLCYPAQASESSDFSRGLFSWIEPNSFFRAATPLQIKHAPNRNQSPDPQETRQNGRIMLGRIHYDSMQENVMGWQGDGRNSNYSTVPCVRVVVVAEAEVVGNT